MRDAAIILAAGKGTRMRSRIAKVLHPLAGHPLLWYPVNLSRARKLSPVSVVIGHQGEEVMAAIGSDGIDWVWQREQLGTGHAVRLAVEHIGKRADRAFILYGDVPLVSAELLKGLQRAFRSAGGPLAMVTVEMPDPSGYGRIVRDASGNMVEVVEHRDCNTYQHKITEINAGIYLVDLPFLRDALARVEPNPNSGEFYLTDIIAMAARAGRVGTCTATPEETAGVNSQADLVTAHVTLRRMVAQDLLSRGVSLIDPDSTYIGPEAKLSKGVQVFPGCHIIGASRVATGAVLEPGVILIDSVIGEGARIRAYSHLEQARVDAHAIVGPFARLRPKAHIEAGAEVGNFIELKNTRLGAKAKAHHVGYLGDAIIGPRSNVGAGTITCNYDGFGKHPTVIGKEVFIGSNSTLVAPVRIGAEAYVAAGSTITDEVKPGALAFGRARQENKDGYALLLRKRLAERKKKTATKK